jgi:uncharacterized Zn-finger protein
VLTVHENICDHNCPQCEKAFSQESYLMRHVLTVHENIRDHNCTHCENAFSQESHLRRHVLSVHESCVVQFKKVIR